MFTILIFFLYWNYFGKQYAYTLYIRFIKPLTYIPCRDITLLQKETIL